MMKNTRNIKVGRKYRNRKWDMIAVPQICLSGKWLNLVGFNIGNTIEVKHYSDKIVITKKPDSKKDKNRHFKGIY